MPLMSTLILYLFFSIYLSYFLSTNFMFLSKCIKTSNSAVVNFMNILDTDELKS